MKGQTGPEYPKGPNQKLPNGQKAPESEKVKKVLMVKKVSKSEQVQKVIIMPSSGCEEKKETCGRGINSSASQQI